MSTDVLALEGEADAARTSRGRLRRWYAALVLALAFPVIAAFVAFRDHPRPPEVAALFVREAVVETTDGDARTPARTVALPYRCTVTQGGDGCIGNFRIPHRQGPDDGRLWSLYIPAYQGSLTVSLNGVLVASSRWDKSVADISGSVPMLVPLPAPLLRPGDNMVEIALARHPSVSSFVDRVAIGPDEHLRPEYSRRAFLFSTLPRMIDGWQIAMGLALFLVWLARRRETIFLVFSALLLFHVTQSFPALLGESVDEQVLRLANHGRLFAACLILPLVWLFVGRRPPIPIGLFLLPPLAVMTSQLMVPPETHLWLLTSVAVPFLVLLMAWGCVDVLRAAVGNRDAAAMTLFGTLVVVLVFTVHDSLVLRDALGENRVMLGRLASPVVMVTISGVLIWRFAQTMNALDQFSARLKREVSAAEDALRRSFVREQAQARTVVLQEERVRLMSDLHDGIAGQLVSILSLCELRDDGPDDVTDTVRAALSDLRLIVASLEDFGEDLGVMLALFRERIEPQVTAHGMALVWRMEPLPELKGLHPGAVLAIYRLLQEAATNACRHSGSDTLVFEAGLSPQLGCGVRLVLRDHGRGGAAGRTGGHGLGNMRRRAESLGATFSIASGAEGTTVALDLPARLP